MMYLTGIAQKRQGVTWISWKFCSFPSREIPGAVESAIPVAACPRSLTRQDLLKRPLNPLDFFADYSDRLLVLQWVGHRSDSFQSASYLTIPSPNEVQPCAPRLAISNDRRRT